MADITFNTLSDTTQSTITAKTGNFDELMKTVTLHLEDQFSAGRITGTDYATVYLGALQSVLAQAVTFTLNMNKANAEKLLVDAQELKVDAETTLLGKKGATEDKQLLVMEEQIDLFEEQAKGFKWNADAKYLKSLLDAKGLSDSLADSPTSVTNLGASNINTQIANLKPS
jgi:hypothetical protein